MTQRELEKLIAARQMRSSDEYSAPRWGRENTYCPVCGAPLREDDLLIHDARSGVVIGCEACTYTAPA